MSKKQMSNFIKVAIFILGIAAGVLLLMQSFRLSTGDNNLLEGTKIIFGGLKDDSSINFDFKFNILLFIAFIAPIAGGIIGIFVKNKAGLLSSVALFIVSIVLLLTIKETNYQVSIGSITSTFKVAIELAPLGWISLVLSGIAGVSSAVLLSE